MGSTVAQSPFSVSWLVHRIVRRCIGAAAADHARGLLLDIGCGQRPYEPLLLQYARAYVGLESDRTRYGSSPHPPDMWGSGLSLPLRDQRADTIVAFQVLEHVPAPARLFAECRRVLRPGGCLIETAPHIWGVHEEPEDYFRFTGFGLANLSRQAGLRVDSVRAMAGYWVTAGTRLCYYLQHFEKIGLALLLRPVYAVIQIAAMTLDRLHRVEGDTWNFILVASKDDDGTD